MKCDLNCLGGHLHHGITYCCRGCGKSRKYLKKKYLTKWTDKFGFWCITGCRLGEDRPQKCKDYDCKKYIFYSVIRFIDGKWITTGLQTIPKELHDKEFVNKYNKLFKDIKNAS